MKIIVLLSALCLGLASSQQFDFADDEYDFYLVPVLRHKRDVTYGVQGEGTKATGFSVGHAGESRLNGGHSITGEGFVGKTISGPTSVGGNVGYTHNPSGVSVNAQAVKTPSFGTNVQVGVNKNIINQGGVELNAFAGGSQNFGGPWGNTKPEGHVGVNFQYRPPPPPAPAPRKNCRIFAGYHRCD